MVMETAIRWSPSSTTSEQRFLIADVVGRTFKLCRVKEYTEDSFQYEAIATRAKTPQFRAFDWSPSDDALVAIGQWTGEATILRIDESKQETLSLPIKHQRVCNAVAFSSSGLLATGLERVRNDFCLNIFDLHQSSTSVSASAPEYERRSVQPLRKLASSEVITSLKFFTGQPDTLVAGVKASCIKIYDLRDSSGAASLQLHTRCVHNIAIDPLDENYFASASPQGEATVSIWDRRQGARLTAANLISSGHNEHQDVPMLELKDIADSSNSVQADLWSLRYCKSRRGLLGVLTSAGQYEVVDVWKQHFMQTRKREQAIASGARQSEIEPQEIFTKGVQYIAHPYYDEKRGCGENNRIVSFDFTNLAGIGGAPCAIILRGDGKIGPCELKSSSSTLAISSRGNVTIACNRPNVQIESRDQVAKNLYRVIPQENGAMTELVKSMHSLPSTTENTDASNYSTSRDIFSMKEALNLVGKAHRRCTEGYLFDCEKNIEILSDDPWIQDLWVWIGRSKEQAADQGMVAEDLDLSFTGVCGLWNPILGFNEASRKATHADIDGDVAVAIKSLCKKLNLPRFEGVQTAHPEHRQLCLYTCGLGMAYDDIEVRVRTLVSDGHHTKAAALAIIHNKTDLALQALRSDRATSAHTLLSLGLAGFAKGKTNHAWVETVQDIAKDLVDPYARAILALVKHGSWRDVLETSLPLKDRVGVALMYLEDDELSHYISRTTTQVIQNGDTEGIVLTGLTKMAVDLFENYILKFHDPQTAVLALSFTCPRYISDIRYDYWRENYRASLNARKLFLHRAHFDVQSTKLAKTFDGRTLARPVPRQVSLRCNNCDQALDRNRDHHHHTTAVNSSTTEQPGSGSHKGSILGGPQSGIVCPKCGAHMPRCAICMMWVGVPDPLSRGGVAAAAAAEKDPMAKFISVCQSCKHVFHGKHADEWFGRHEVCPVPDCRCRCASLDGDGR